MMKRPMVKMLIVASLAVVFHGSIAVAQQGPTVCPEKPANKKAARQAAKKWFAVGESLFDLGNYEESLGAFQCSLKMEPHPATIYNASQSALFGQDRSAALELMEQYLSMAPDGEKAQEVKKAIEELTAAMEAELAQAEEEKKDASLAEPGEELGDESLSSPPGSKPSKGLGRLGLVPLIVSAALTAGLGVTTLVLDVEVGNRFDKAESTGRPSDRRSAESLQVAEQVFLGLTAAGVLTTGVLAIFTKYKKSQPETESTQSLVGPLLLERGVGLSLTKGF
jgi:tetratricopeptide (TPR) repeat protein